MTGVCLQRMTCAHRARGLSLAGGEYISHLTTWVGPYQETMVLKISFPDRVVLTPGCVCRATTGSGHAIWHPLHVHVRGGISRIGTILSKTCLCSPHPSINKQMYNYTK